MTPKEEADELCREMLLQLDWNAEPSVLKGVAKECAMICAKKLLNYAKAHGFISLTTHYESVIQEIKKL